MNVLKSNYGVFLIMNVFKSNYGYGYGYEAAGSWSIFL